MFSKNFEDLDLLKICHDKERLTSFSTVLCEPRTGTSNLWDSFKENILI